MKPTTLQLKATRLLALDQRRKAHHCALSMLHDTLLPTQEEHEARGLKMWRKLKRLESEARQQTTAQNNGKGLAPGYFQAFCDRITADAAKVFGGMLPDGFFINTDWREPSLKLEARYTPEVFPTDRAGNGILCGKVSI